MNAITISEVIFFDYPNFSPIYLTNIHPCLTLNAHRHNHDIFTLILDTFVHSFKFTFQSENPFESKLLN